jgi:hypothetical protein
MGEPSGRVRLTEVSGEGTCVVHLVWAPLGPRPLARFLDSYRRHDAGADHRLVILFNGFPAEQDVSPWRLQLADLEHEELRVGGAVLDLAAYREAAERTRAARYCFLNSYSLVLAEDWLGALERALRAPGVGLVGATGSWASVRSHLRFMLGLGGPYARVFPDRREAIATLAAAGARDAPPAQGGRRDPLGYARALLGQTRGFAPFPAAHIRTTGFMVEAGLLGQVAMPKLARKIDVYRLESGRESLTAQVARMGLATLVVGRDGRAYRPDQWPASRTLWQGNQENLLIADKRTEDYELGDADARATLSRYAWGRQADPRPPAAPHERPAADD